MSRRRLHECRGEIIKASVTSCPSGTDTMNRLFDSRFVPNASSIVRMLLSGHSANGPRP